MKTREQMIKELTDNLQALNTKVDELEKQTTTLKADVREKIKGEIEKIKSQRDKTLYQVSLLKSASESAYDEMATGVKKAMGELKAALHASKEKLGL